MCSQKKDTQESFVLLFFSPKKLVQLFVLKGVKPSPDSKIIKHLTLNFSNLILPATTTFLLKDKNPL